MNGEAHSGSRMDSINRLFEEMEGFQQFGSCGLESDFPQSKRQATHSAFYSAGNSNPYAQQLLDEEDNDLKESLQFAFGCLDVASQLDYQA